MTYIAQQVDMALGILDQLAYWLLRQSLDGDLLLTVLLAG